MAGGPAQNIAVSGEWNETIDASNLTSGAGSDLTASYESPGPLTLDILANLLTPDWRVDVSRSDTNWHGDFTLNIRRTNDGTGSGNIDGGKVYQEITTVSDTFFSGSKDRSDVGFEYQLTGVSVAVPPDIYATQVTFTIKGL